jgi:peptide/nickel transport system permease protein
MSLKSYIKSNDNLYFALRDKRVIIGLVMFVFFLLIGLVGPMFAPYDPQGMDVAPMQPPSGDYLMGTTYYGEDVFSQVLYGLRNTIFMGFIGGVIGIIIGLLIGFIAGYYGGKAIDEVLMLFTNVLLVLPVLAILIILGCYLQTRGIVIEGVIIGCTSWPWVARAVRAQTLSIKNREYVNLSRISSLPTRKILVQDIAASMLSYNVMAFILQFQGAILTSVGFDVIGLGPTDGNSIGMILYHANQGSATMLGFWWWPFFPGLIVTLLITSLFLINTGLLEVFNPKLREM